jgi:magnesium transporter
MEQPSWLTKTGLFSQYIEEGDQRIITLKFLRLEIDSLEEETISSVMQAGSFYEWNHLTREKKDFKNESELYKNLLNRTEKEIEMLLQYIEEVDSLEDLLYERRQPRYFLNIGFRLKRDVLKLERVFNRRLIVLREASSHHQAGPLLKSIIQKLDAYSKNTGHQIQRLESMQRFFESIKQDKMNNNIYLLALVSTIFLPLNLIVGFFGINTENLFFSGNPKGTLFVVLILVGTFVFLLIALPLIRLMDQWLLNRIFGRSRFYGKLMKRIQA